MQSTVIQDADSLNEAYYNKYHSIAWVTSIDWSNVSHGYLIGEVGEIIDGVTVLKRKRIHRLRCCGRKGI